MIRCILTILTLFFSSYVFSNESDLTISQQLERLQREVSDLSQTVFSSKNDIKLNNSNDSVKNLSAIDMRIYDLEKDVKSLTSNLEEIYFQIHQINQMKQIVILLKIFLLSIYEYMILKKI